MDNKKQSTFTEQSYQLSASLPPKYRDFESSHWRFFQTWYALVCHLLLCIGLSLVMVFLLDGYLALAADDQPRQQPNGRYIFRVSDITTLVSAALLLVKFTVSAYTGVTMWRCAYALFENGGLDLGSFSRMISWGIPPLKKSRGGWVWGAVAVVALCLLPQQLISPLLQGSVDWRVTLTSGPEVQVESGGEGALQSDWYWYLLQEVTRKYYVRRAAGLATVAFNSDTMNEGGTGCRHVVENNQLPVDSFLANATIPCIEIHDITWATAPVPDDIYTITASSDTLSLVSDAPFMYYQSGVAILYDRENYNWDSQNLIRNTSTHLADYPNATLFSGTMTVVMMLDRQNATSCKPVEPNAFGDISQVTSSSVFGVGNAYDENCYTYGTVNFTAGVVKPLKSRYISSQVVEADDLAHGTDEDATASIEPSIWVREALFLLPDVMTMIAIINSSFMPTWNNLDNYTATLIRYGYIANWDMLHASFEQNDTTILTAIRSEQRLEALVSRARVFGWLGVSMLMVVSGIIVSRMQAKSCKRGIILDFPAAVLLTDASGVVDEHPDVTRMSYLTGKDKELGKLYLSPVSDQTGRFKLCLEKES